MEMRRMTCRDGDGCGSGCERSAWSLVRRGRTHQCVDDVLEHGRWAGWLKPQEESRRTHRASSAAVNLCRMIIAAPHEGHCQSEFSQVAGVVFESAVGESGVSSWRHRDTRAARNRLARKPKWRMRTNALGSPCRKKRRKNSQARSFI